MPRRVTTKNRWNDEQDSAIRAELRSACQANDSQRVDELFRRGTVSAADATACLEHATKDLPSMRILLENGADSVQIASIKYMSRSFELVKLLVEFGYDISANGHCILQYVGPTQQREHS